MSDQFQYGGEQPYYANPQQQRREYEEQQRQDYQTQQRSQEGYDQQPQQTQDQRQSQDRSRDSRERQNCGQEEAQERIRQQEEQRQQEQERNAKAQQLGDARPVDLAEIDEMVKGGYANIDQPGLDPRNFPSNTVEALQKGERPEHKSTKDLEDITGNPGHRGVTPYAPATSFNAAPRADGFMDSINEPCQRQ